MQVFIEFYDWRRLLFVTSCGFSYTHIWDSDKIQNT